MNVKENLRRLNHAMNGVMGLYHDVSQMLGISDSVFQILYTVCNSQEKCCLSEIARLNGLSKQTVNSAIRKLESQGIIHLEQGRGRSRFVCLTPQGEIYAQEHIAPIMRIEEQLLENWTEEDCREYLRLTEKYYADFARTSEALKTALAECARRNA